MSATRGPYAKGIARRREILDAALRIIARDGYSKATVKELAEEVGLSQMGLLHHFGSKEALFVAVLERRDEIDLEARRPDLPTDPRDVAEFIRHNSRIPGLIQLYSRLSNEASDPQHSAHEHFRDRYDVLRENGTRAFDELKAGGLVPPDADSARLAVLLFAMIDGLQTQWLYDSSIDMPGSVEYFFTLLAAKVAV